MKYIPTEISTLIKSCNTLVQLTTLYFGAIWTWALFQFVMDTFKVFLTGLGVMG
mgnify:CR=1 FL=1